MENKTTCFLFGEEACEEWYQFVGADIEFIPMLDEMQISYDIFYFTKGFTPPEELLLAYDGWRNWAILPEKAYKNHFNSLEKEQNGKNCID